MKKVIEFNQKCQKCDGTGLYIGFAERDGAAVVCHTCKGTGCFKFRHEYEEFEGRVPRTDVKRVFETNPGIGIREGKGFKLSDFGGMSYEEWNCGAPFEWGTENRKHTCPAWWYQCADYKKKPDWKECNGCGSFSDCKQFPNKVACWIRFDAEQMGK